MLSACRRILLYMLAPIVFGLWVFHYYYGIWFTDTDYISWRVGNGECETWILGWTFFRNEPWLWPPGKFLRYGFPYGGSVALTGSIPLVAIPLKLFSHHLTVDFQYFGAWMALCYVLQACAGAMLTRLATKNPLAILAGALLFVSIPLLVVMQMCCIGTHWLLLFALWLYLVDYKRVLQLRTFIALSVSLNIMAMAVFPYLAAMVFALSCALYVRLGIIEKSISRKSMYSLLGGVALADLLSLYLAGGFVIPMKDFTNATGLEWPLALDGLFSSGGFSRFRFMGTYSPLYGGERYMYLGLGLLLIGLLGACSFVIKEWRKRRSRESNPDIGSPIRWKYWAPLIVVCSVFLFYAISNNVYLDCDHRLFDFPLPNLFLKLVLPFRECARFFWPCYYLIIFLIILSVLKGFDYRIATALLWFAVAIQLCEFKGIPGKEKWNAPLKGQLLTGLVGGGHISYATPLKDSVWHHIRDYKGITIFPNVYRVKTVDDFFYFDYLAANHGLFATCAYLARNNDKEVEYLKTMIQDVKKGHVDGSLIYVLNNVERDILMPWFSKEGICGIVDGYTVCVKNSDNDFCRELKHRNPEVGIHRL